MKGLEEILKLCSEKQVEWYMIAEEVVDSLENAVDRAGDAVDIVRLVAISLRG